MHLIRFALLALTCVTITAHAALDTLWTRVVEVAGGEYLELTGTTGLSNGGFAFCGNAWFGEPFYQNAVLGVTDAAGNIVWSEAIGGTGSDYGWDVWQMTNGNLLLFGTRINEGSFEIFTTISCYTIAGDSLWTVDYPELEFSGYNDSAKLSDGNFAYVTTTEGDLPGTRVVIVRKLSSAGQSLWTRTYEFSGYVAGRQIDETASGDLIVAGEVVDELTGIAAAFLMRTDAAGVERWRQTYTSPDGFGINVTGLQEDASGNIFLCAGVAGIWWFNGGMLLKTEADGDLIWQGDAQMFFGLEYTGVVPQAGGGCIAAGTVWSDFGFPYGVLVEYGADGDTLESQSLETIDSGFWGLESLYPSGAMAYGFQGDTQGGRDGILIRLGPPTTVVGTVRHVTNDDPLPGIRVDLSDGSFAITDQEGAYAIPTLDTTITIVASGACITTQTLADYELTPGEINVLDIDVGIPEYSRTPSSINVGVQFDLPYTANIAITNSGSGDLPFTAVANSLQPDFEWLSVSPANGVLHVGESLTLHATIFVDSEQGTPSELFGNVTVRNHSCPDSIDIVPIAGFTLAAEDDPGAPRSFALHPAYPNPFNATTQLSFNLPSPGNAQLELFDVTGRLVRTIAAGAFEAGAHRLELSLSDETSGVYFVRLRAGTKLATQKIILLK